MHNKLSLKQKLLTTIEDLGKQKGLDKNVPITNSIISSEIATKIETITQSLESLNPFPQPLLYGLNLLEGIWQLNYSTAREIRSLNALPFGFQLQEVYQIINTEKASFFNIAFVKHSSKLIKGYVKVTANFAPAIDENVMVPQKRINVDFQKRYIYISKILGIKTPYFEPIQVFNANNPPGRTPCLDITYLDESLRIGRGGEGSLFILSKQEKMNFN